MSIFANIGFGKNSPISQAIRDAIERAKVEGGKKVDGGNGNDVPPREPAQNPLDTFTPSPTFPEFPLIPKFPKLRL